jgi:hypothetical protein
VIFWLAGLTLFVAFFDAEWVRKFAVWGGDWLLKHHWDKEFVEWWPLALLTASGLLAGFILLKVLSWRHKRHKENDRASQGGGN